jgi:hypothetical protein
MAWLQRNAPQLAAAVDASSIHPFLGAPHLMWLTASSREQRDQLTELWVGSWARDGQRRPAWAWTTGYDKQLRTVARAFLGQAQALCPQLLWGMWYGEPCVAAQPLQRGSQPQWYSYSLAAHIRGGILFEEDMVDMNPGTIHDLAHYAMTTARRHVTGPSVPWNPSQQGDDGQSAPYPRGSGPQQQQQQQWQGQGQGQQGGRWWHRPPGQGPSAVQHQPPHPAHWPPPGPPPPPMQHTAPPLQPPQQDNGPLYPQHANPQLPASQQLPEAQWPALNAQQQEPPGSSSSGGPPPLQQQQQGLSAGNSGSAPPPPPPPPPPPQQQQQQLRLMGGNPDPAADQQRRDTPRTPTTAPAARAAAEQAVAHAAAAQEAGALVAYQPQGEDTLMGQQGRLEHRREWGTPGSVQRPGAQRQRLDQAPGVELVNQYALLAGVGDQ